MVDYSIYSTILFLDSMVALEGKPLPQQAWCEIDPKGPILLLVVPQVSTEIDKRKRDGRLATRARAFNRLIGAAAESGKPHRIVEGNPAVDIGIAITNRIKWDELDDLDPDEGDAKVVAQILNTRDVAPDKKLLLSQDINPISMAARHGLKAVRLPDHWLLEPEPSPSEKALSKMKARISELEASEPDLRLNVEFLAPLPLTLFKVRPYPAPKRSSLASAIIAKNPRKPNGRQPYVHLYGDYDSSYDEKYERYRDVLVDRYVQTLHRNVELWYGQIPFKLTLENVGSIQAENLILTLSASEQGRLHDRFASFHLYGPIPPTPKPFSLMDQMNNIRTFDNFARQQVGRHEMEFQRKPDRSNKVEIHCQDFRHGHIWEFEGIAIIAPDDPSPFTIATSASASNMRGVRNEVYELCYVVREVDVSDLIDPIGQTRKEVPAERLFEKAIREKNTEMFEFLSLEKNWREFSEERQIATLDDANDTDDTEA